jgi:alpha-beta hydrolase superfamily lysophospholipase
MKPMLMSVVKMLPIAIAVITATILVIRGLDARKMRSLRPWHRNVLSGDFRADTGDCRTLGDYLRKEDRLFAELADFLRERPAADASDRWSRYNAGGPNDPDGFEPNWNRTFERIPDTVRGRALLLHGLTDSPYSLRWIAADLLQEGIHVLALRLPGHGTLPTGITATDWEDWLGAVTLAADYLRSLPGGHPLFMVGYSNGGALALKFTLEELARGDEPLPDQLILVSPAIAVSPFGAMADWHKAISFLPWFEKFRWLEIEPEYDPFKYNSFPKHAGRQTYRLTQAVQRDLAAMGAADRLGRFPPILTIQSVADSTVDAWAVIRSLYDRLPGEGNELVLFDINRLAQARTFLKSDHHDALTRLIHAGSERTYRLTIVTNRVKDDLGVEARSWGPADMRPVAVPLGLDWPEGVYSLSHVAVPIAPEDRLYGRGDSRGPSPLSLGRLEPRGEMGLLRVSVERLMRLRYNPFYPYLRQRIATVVRRHIDSEGG